MLHIAERRVSLWLCKQFQMIWLSLCSVCNAFWGYIRESLSRWVYIYFFFKFSGEHMTYKIIRHRIGSSGLELHLHCLSSHITGARVILKFFWLSITIFHWNFQTKRSKFNHIGTPSCNLSKQGNRYII